MNTNFLSPYVRRFFLLVALFLMAGLVACGGGATDDSVETAPAPPATAEVVEEAPTPPTLTDAEAETPEPATTEVVEPEATVRPNAPTVTPTPEATEETPEPEANEKIYLEMAEGEALEYGEDEVLLVIYAEAVDGNLFDIFDDNGMPSEEADIEMSYLFDRSVWSPAYTNGLFDCALQHVRGDAELISCLEGYAEAASEMPFVPATGSFDGPECHMEIDQIQVTAYEEYNTIDLVVHPDQGVVTWSSTNMSDDDFWRQHSYRNSDGCSVLTIGHNEDHPTGINFVVRNASDEVIWDQDLWLGD